ncbi:MAG: efflux RND transporter permease subunit, partial [Epsilonproteobacteria bacterium]|nr:efflux RND transporter permease subunit [Campylobacterota bacterium]
FDSNKLLDIKTQSINKDNLSNFESIKIPLKDGSMVPLKDICTFEKVKSLERLIKDDGETTFYVFANVNPKITTSGEAMKKIRPVLEKLKKEGLRFKLRGEAEQKRSLRSSMLLASALAITLIFISILYMFNSIRETLIIMSVIPFSFLGVFIGHSIMGLNLSLPSLIGALGLAGVIVNDGIIMMATIKTAKTPEEIFPLAAKRFRPIILTSVTTILGLTSLIFFASGQAATFQPMAVTLGFGLLWGTILNLIYLPTMYNFLHQYKALSKKQHA